MAETQYEGRKKERNKLIHNVKIEKELVEKRQMYGVFKQEEIKGLT